MHRRAEAAVFVLIVAAYAVLGLWVLEPDAVYSGDIGVKFVQARALAASHFTSLNIRYPGQFLDQARQFFPLRAPFVMATAGETQAIFSPASAVIQALAVSVAGMRGMILVSLLAGAVILASTWRLAPDGDGIAVLLALGIAGPLWFYAISGWEHAPAVAFSTLAFALAVRSPSAFAPLVAGLCLGAGATQRDEVLLLGPGLLLIVWLRTRAVSALSSTVIGMVVPLAGAAMFEVWWFKRPVAAHLRHAVHLLQSALRVSDAPNPDVPALQPFTLRERYEAVVQYWLLGYGRDPLIAAFAAGLAIALAIRIWLRSAWGLVVWLIAVVALAWIDLHELVTAPKWLAGLHRVSPYLLFALFPLPALVKRLIDDAGSDSRTATPWLRPAVLWTTLAYLVLAFAGADTSGGKALGPRLLLPLVPLLTVIAVATIGCYLRAPSIADRWAGRIGVLLVLMSAVMHLAGTIPAYAARNQGDSDAVEAIAKGPLRVVVADDPFTAQLLFPLYYRKIVFLVDSPEHAQALASALGQNKVGSFVLVSRLEHPELTFAPYRLQRAEQRGRLALQYLGSLVPVIVYPIAIMRTEREQAQKNIAENRKAFHDYHILETFEAGVALVGTEVKSIRGGNVNLRDSYARVESGEIWVYNIHVSPYSHRGYSDHEPTRRRKLLLHRQEIRKLIGKTVEKGMTLVPTRMYFQNGHVKIAIGLAKGKKAHDKRETEKRREADRETRAAVKERRSR